MAGTALPHPLAARLALDLGGDGLEEATDQGPGSWIAAGHQGGPVARPLLAPGDAQADEVQAGGLELGMAPGAVGVMGVAPVHDDIARRQERQELIDDRVHPGPCLDHQQHHPWVTQGRDQLRQGRTALDIPPRRLTDQEVPRPLPGAVVDRHRVAMIAEVEHQIAAHDRQPDDADVRLTHEHLLKCDTGIPPAR